VGLKAPWIFLKQSIVTKKPLQYHIYIGMLALVQIDEVLLSPECPTEGQQSWDDSYLILFLSSHSFFSSGDYLHYLLNYELFGSVTPCKHPRASSFKVLVQPFLGIWTTEHLVFARVLQTADLEHHSHRQSSEQALKAR
jgi:hypothetical protein